MSPVLTRNWIWLIPDFAPGPDLLVTLYPSLIPAEPFLRDNVGYIANQPVAAAHTMRPIWAVTVVAAAMVTETDRYLRRRDADMMRLKQQKAAERKAAETAGAAGGGKK